MKWSENLSVETAGALVDTAFRGHRSGMHPGPEALAASVCAPLSAEMTHRLLADLGRIARADGVFTRVEAIALHRARSGTVG